MKKFVDRSLQPTQQGFTLIELLVAIMVLLVAITFGYSTYENYIFRARLQEGFNQVEKAKIITERFYRQNKRLPKRQQDNEWRDAIKWGEGDDMLVEATFKDGRVRFRYHLGDGVNIVLYSQAYIDGLGLKWKCGFKAPSDYHYLIPARCAVRGNRLPKPWLNE